MNSKTMIHIIDFYCLYMMSCGMGLNMYEVKRCDSIQGGRIHSIDDKKTVMINFKSI